MPRNSKSTKNRNQDASISSETNLASKQKKRTSERTPEPSSTTKKRKELEDKLVKRKKIIETPPESEDESQSANESDEENLKVNKKKNGPNAQLRNFLARERELDEEEEIQNEDDLEKRVGTLEQLGKESASLSLLREYAKTLVSRSEFEHLKRQLENQNRMIEELRKPNEAQSARSLLKDQYGIMFKIDKESQDRSDFIRWGFETKGISKSVLEQEYKDFITTQRSRVWKVYNSYVSKLTEDQIQRKEYERFMESLERGNRIKEHELDWVKEDFLAKVRRREQSFEKGQNRQQELDVDQHNDGNIIENSIDAYERVLRQHK